MKRKLFALCIIALLLLCTGCRKSAGAETNSSSMVMSTSEDYAKTNTSSIDETNTDQTAENELTSSSGQSQVSAVITPQKQNESSASSVTSSMGHGQSVPDPVPESLNWTSLAGNWEFYTDNKERNSASRYFVLDFSIDEEGHTDISSGGFVLPQDVPNLSYDITTNNKWIFNSNTYYLFWGWDGYYGNFFITQGSEDLPVLEMRCYDGSGNFFLTDELQFKRLDNDTLQYIGYDYEPLHLCTGDILKK